MNTENHECVGREYREPWNLASLAVFGGPQGVGKGGDGRRGHMTNTPTHP